MAEGSIKLDIGALQESLILPLWARAMETDKKHPIIHDPIAKKIISSLDYDFSQIESNKEFANNQQIQWALRAYHFDCKIREFLEHNDNATVINIGAGLDATFHRVDNGKVEWINIELPDVAHLREQIVPDMEREKTIATSVFDYNWMDDIVEQTKNRSIMFMAAGVFFYFSKAEMRRLLSKMADRFPKSQIVFDVLSSKVWVTLTNLVVMSRSGMDPSVRLKWYLKRARQLQKWIKPLKVIDEYSMFSRIQPGDDWDKKVIRDMKIGNTLKVYNMVHVLL